MMNAIEALKKLGIDVSEGLDRVMGDSDLYEMMLGMFVDAVRDNPIAPEEFDSGDLDEVIKKAHMLKGVTGNLSLTPLFESYTKMLGLLRGGQAAEGKAEFLRMQPVQAEIIDCIKGHTGAQ